MKKLILFFLTISVLSQINAENFSILKTDSNDFKLIIENKKILLSGFDDSVSYEIPFNEEYKNKKIYDFSSFSKNGFLLEIDSKIVLIILNEKKYEIFTFPQNEILGEIIDVQSVSDRLLIFYEHDDLIKKITFDLCEYEIIQNELLAKDVNNYIFSYESNVGFIFIFYKDDLENNFLKAKIILSFLDRNIEFLIDEIFYKNTNVSTFYSFNDIKYFSFLINNELVLYQINNNDYNLEKRTFVFPDLLQICDFNVNDYLEKKLYFFNVEKKSGNKECIIFTNDLEIYNLEYQLESFNFSPNKKDHFVLINYDKQWTLYQFYFVSQQLYSKKVKLEYFDENLRFIGPFVSDYFSLVFYESNSCNFYFYDFDLLNSDFSCKKIKADFLSKLENSFELKIINNLSDKFFIHSKNHIYILNLKNNSFSKIPYDQFKISSVINNSISLLVELNNSYKLENYIGE